MKNQIFTGTPTSRRFAPCPITVVAGDAVLLGKQPAVALDSYQPPAAGKPGGTTFLLNGTFALTVIAVNAHSPAVGVAIKPGDPLYASGTLDSTTNVTTGLTISAVSTDTAFGNLDPEYSTITSGSTDTAAEVQIHG